MPCLCHTTSSLSLLLHSLSVFSSFEHVFKPFIDYDVFEFFVTQSPTENLQQTTQLYNQFRALGGLASTPGTNHSKTCVAGNKNVLNNDGSLVGSCGAVVPTTVNLDTRVYPHTQRRIFHFSFCSLILARQNLPQSIMSICDSSNCDGVKMNNDWIISMVSTVMMIIKQHHLSMLPIHRCGYKRHVSFLVWKLSILLSNNNALVIDLVHDHSLKLYFNIAFLEQYLTLPLTYTPSSTRLFKLAASRTETDRCMPLFSHCTLVELSLN